MRMAPSTPAEGPAYQEMIAPRSGLITPRRWRWVARAVWLLIAAPTVAVLLMSAGPRYQQLATVSENAETIAGQLLPAEAAALADLGMTPRGYGLYFTGLELIVGLVLVTIGTYIFLGRSQELVVWLFSIMLVTFGLTSSPLAVPLGAADPVWAGLILILRTLGFAFIITGFLIFPDGRFSPRWTRWAAVFWTVFLLASLMIPAFRIPSSLAFSGTAHILLIIWAMSWLILVASIQVYRYRTHLTIEQRQQTKWVVFGLAFSMGFSSLAAGLMVLLYLVRQPLQVVIGARLVAFSVILVAGVFLGISIAMAVLRHRLWDIDLIIRRTLAFTLISAILAAVYFGTVVVLQAGFNALTGQDSPLAVALSTLAIAGLFNPIRNGIQRTIALRFDRRSYDVEQALEGFGESMRHQVDLNQILGSLGAVLVESLGPESVSLWLRTPKRERREHE